MLHYEYIDFDPDEFDFSYCEKVPFRHQLEDHPIASESDMELLRNNLTEWEQSVIINQSYYFIYDSYLNKRISEQSDSLIPIENCPFSVDVHGNSIDVIKKRLISSQGTFSFLMGNNEYRPYTDRLFKHAHQPTEIGGVVNKNTFTMIYPVKIVDDITEKFKIFFAEEDGLYKLLKAPLSYPEKDVTTIDFPSKGKALLIHFNSVNGIHWVEGLSNNNFLCHAFDSVTLKGELC
jgi:hypothetical protein